MSDITRTPALFLWKTGLPGTAAYITLKAYTHDRLLMGNVIFDVERSQPASYP